VFASGQPLDLGSSTFRRQALIWYLLRSVIDRLEDEDPWFTMNLEIKAIWPANTITDTSFNGSDKIYLHQGQPDDDWHPDFVLKQFMLMWHDLHTEGSRKISGWPSAAFAHGFSLFASNALLHELWGIRLNRPLSRRTVAAELALSTLDEIEGSEPGVKNALRLLRCGERKGWWSHLFGTAQSYPDHRPDDDGDGDPDHPDEVGVSTGSTGVCCRPIRTSCRSGTSCGPSERARARAGTRTWRSGTRTTACSGSSTEPSTSMSSARTCARC
jgi:hypothetical protein